MFFFPKNQENNNGSDCYNMDLKIVMNSNQTNDWLVQSLMKLRNVLKNDTGGTVPTPLVQTFKLS